MICLDLRSTTPAAGAPRSEGGTFEAALPKADLHFTMLSARQHVTDMNGRRAPAGLPQGSLFRAALRYGCRRCRILHLRTGHRPDSCSYIILCRTERVLMTWVALEELVCKAWFNETRWCVLRLFGTDRVPIAFLLGLVLITSSV